MFSFVFYERFYLHERAGADWRERSVLPAEAKPPLGDFVGAPVISVIVWEVPRVGRRLDDGVLAGDALFTNTHAHTHSQLKGLLLLTPRSVSTYQEPDSASRRHVSVYDQLVAPLPLEEEAPDGSVGQTGFVVPHQVPAHEAAVMARVQSGVQ